MTTILKGSEDDRGLEWWGEEFAGMIQRGEAGE